MFTVDYYILETRNNSFDDSIDLLKDHSRSASDPTEINEYYSDVEAGTCKQRVESVVNADGRNERLRIKESKTINEAVIYHRVTTDARYVNFIKFLPVYRGASDLEGNEINIAERLQQAPNIHATRTKIKVKMVDILDQIRSDGGTITEAPRDFKFNRPSLLSNQREVTVHNQSRHCYLFRVIRELYLSASRCSFAYQSGGKNSSNIFSYIFSVIRGFFSVCGTQSELRKQFSRLSHSELSSVIDSLTTLKSEMANLDFVCLDSSLLFIPYEQDGLKKLKIKLIDLGHAIGRDEGIDTREFEQTRADATNSLEELIGFANQELSRKQIQLRI